MTSAVYPLWKQELMKGTAASSLNGTGTTGVYAALVDTATYTYSAAHQFYSSVSAASRIGTPDTEQELTSKTFVNGTFDAADITFPSVSDANTADAIVLYVKNAGGGDTTWQLVAYIDSATGLPVTPNGGNITVTWNGSGIFTL